MDFILFQMTPLNNSGSLPSIAISRSTSPARHIPQYLASSGSNGGHGLHFAPIQPNGKSVLDMGTGTGDWVIDMGKLYRGAVIIGTDLSPIQRRKEVSIDARSILSYDNVPVNVEWIMDDLELEWVDPTLYHYIHCIMACRNPTLQSGVLR
ncbi:TAM domain methyltransferase [Metarhizium robertsii ARSEF 23]|uniref:TAM domain methyltransferase n=1 Tax=Metarhizium robertsii (strain ARSEF 23 / ATCC MYA-3075) TaxID=655844 RepID=E9FDC5_METRA|nr:TAM domain methyltransferase [Metarhizium robertsii ARSEF 23]EFY94264.1 TAM domain methyltransferase [Metarhizium robertsii ARSEF 23]